MGTKNEPGQFDCYKAAEPDEPIFVLRGTDPCADVIVKMWAELYKWNKMQVNDWGPNQQRKYVEAINVAHQMREYYDVLTGLKE